MPFFRNKIRSVFATAALLAAGAGATPAFAQEKPRADDSAVQDMEAQANRFLKDNPNPYYDRVVILDPDRFDAEVGMGKSRIGAVQHMLAEKGVGKVPDGLIQALVGRLTHLDVSAEGAPVLTTTPTAFPLVDQRLSIFIATPDNGLVTGIPPPPDGISAQTARSIYNGHELAHTLDPLTDFRKIIPYMPMINHFPVGDMPWDDFPPEGGYPGLIAAYSMLHRDEALADVRALGEAVRGGADPAVISKYADWRMWQANHDPLHASTMALRDLARRVGKMGLPAFRGLSEGAAEEIYVDAASKNGLSTPNAMLAFLIRAFGSEEQKTMVHEMAAYNADARNGVGVYVMWKLHEYMTPPPAAAWNAANAAAAERLKDWDPLREIKKETLARAHKIMPATMLETYTRMRDDLRRQAEANPADDVYFQEKGARLRTAFLGYALHLDIVREKDGAPALHRASAPRPAH